MLTNTEIREEAEVLPLRPKPRKPFATLWPTRPNRARQLARGLELVVALMLSIVAIPLIGLAAFLVRLTSRGPAFYTQIRVGRRGEIFTIYKIRSMVDKCESLTGPRWTIPGDPRITPIGWFLRRTHLDELPQLLNVLKGEMSLIGPRPERPEFVAAFNRQIDGYADRHAVLPGITGLAQVQLPPDSDLASVRRKLLYDLYYAREASLWLDLRILFCTLIHMVGFSCEFLQTLRIVPGPELVEVDTNPVIEAPQRSRQHAA